MYLSIYLSIFGGYMRLIKGQLSLFDLDQDSSDLVQDDDYIFSISEFDSLFEVGSLFLNGSSILEITNLLKGERMAEIKNVTLENKGFYVGQRYYLNKESFGIWYTSFVS